MSKDSFGGGYGATPGQLAALPPGDLSATLKAGLRAVIASPPFSPSGNQPTGRGQGVRQDYTEGKRKESSPESDYGETVGQLQKMPAGDLHAALAVSSPPFRQTSGGVNVTQESGAL